MRRSFPRPLALVVAGLTALALGACGSDDGQPSPGAADGVDTVAAGTLTVGVPTFPPFSSIEGDRIVGPDGEIIYAIAEQLDLEVVAEPYEFSALIPAVQQGRIDVGIGSIFRTNERAEVVDFTDPLYIEPGSIISTEGLSSVDDLHDLRVGTIQGYNWVDDINRELGGALTLYPSSLELKQDLDAGRLDVGIDSYGTALYLYEGTDFQVNVVEPHEQIEAATNPGQVGFVLSQENPGLTEAIDEAIAVLHEEDAIAPILESNGLDPEAADVGEPRFL